MDNSLIDEFKRRALLQQAQGQLPPNIAAPPVPLPDFGQQAPPPSGISVTGMANPMPNLQGAPPPQVMQQAPVVTPVQSQPGPIKSFLQQFVHGAGQGLLTNAGLENDTQRQTRIFNQQQAAAKNASEIALQGAQGDYYSGRNDALTQANAPVSDEVVQKLGLPVGTVVLTKDLPKMILGQGQNQNRLDVQGVRNKGNLAITQLKYGDGAQPGPLNTVIKDIGGRTYLLRRGTGEKLSDLGQSNSVATANARAEASARYGLVNTMDENGNPVSETRLTALQNGNPSVQFDALKQIASDKAGIAQYGDILNNKIAPNLKVLNDPTQRAIIAHTLAEAEKNPGAIQSLLTAGAQGGLTPQGAALAAGILQGREFGGVARKYGGNMNGTEGLMNRIMSNQASPLNSEQLNKELIQNDVQFTNKANATLGGLTKHRQGGSNAPAPPAAPAPAGGWGASFGAVPVKP